MIRMYSYEERAILVTFLSAPKVQPPQNAGRVIDARVVETKAEKVDAGRVLKVTQIMPKRRHE